MGNVLDGPKSSGDIHTEDLKWLSVQNDAIFNDAYVAEVFENLPIFEGTQLPEEVDEKTASQNFTPKMMRIKRLVQLFSAQKDGVTSVENFENLSSLDELEKSAFAKSNKMRARLLQRIHLAMLRSASAQSSSTSNDESFIGIVDNDSFEDADGLLTATSIRMSLAIMQCLAPSNPPLFTAMSSSIMDLLARSSALALSTIESSSPQAESLKAIIDFAQTTASQNNANRSEALALLLAVGVTSGSLSGLLSVVSHLKKGPDRLPPNALPFLQRLQNMTTPLDLSIPSEETSCGDLLAKLSSDHPEADIRSRESSFATDGTHLFVWNSIACSLHKIGTGFHGTIAGNEYVSNPNILQQLSDRLGPLAFDLKSETTVNANEENAGNAAVTGTTTTITVIAACNRIVLAEGDDVEMVLSGEGSADDIVEAELGMSATVLEERTVRLVEFDREVRFFRIAEREWIGEEEPHEDSDVHSESDEEDEVLQFVRTVDVTTVTRTADGSTTVTSSIAEQEDLEQSIQRKAAWVAYIHGKIYLRMEHILGPFRLAVFSASSLKLEDIIDINLPLPEFIKAKKLWLKKFKDQSNMEVEGEESKVDNAVDTMEVVVSMTDEVEPEEWEDGEVVDLIRNVLQGNETVSRPSVVAASSNFMSTGGVQERNLVADEQSYNSENNYHFASGDSDQELIVDLGTVFRVAHIGAEFGPSVHEKFILHVSVDGSTYSPYASLTPVSNTTVVMLTSGQNLTEPPSELVPPVIQEVRYIRFNFGQHDPSGEGSVVNKLFVMGPKRVKKVVQVPFPLLTTDGHNLVFVHSSKKQTEDGSESMLQTFSFEPYVQSSILSSEPTVRNYQWGLDGTEKDFRSCSFLYNGSILIVSHAKGFRRISKDEKTSTFCFWKLDCLTGKLMSSTESSFSKIKGFPSSLVYDSRNNMIWSWSWPDYQVLRWRNAGLAPRFNASRPASRNELFLSSSPHQRLEALSLIPEQELTPKHEAAIILCQLDRLALLYSPPREPVAEGKKFNELEVISAGTDDGNFCKLLVRGQSCGTCARGFNILVLDSHYNPKDFRNFDTHDNTAASERLADFIDGIPQNRIVLVGTMDSANANLTTRGRASLRSLGASSIIEKLASKGSYSLIGRKGANVNEVVQQIGERKGGPIIVSQRLPSPKVPLSMECSYAAIHGLVELVRDHYELIKQNLASPLDISILITSIRLLATNVYQLLCGSPIQKATEIFSGEDRNIIVKIVSEVIDSPPSVEGGQIVAETALQLFITSIDVLYPSPSEKCELLVQYLDEFVNETLSPLEGSVLGLLLRQMSDATSLSKLFRHTQTAEANPNQLLSSLLSISKKETLSKLERLTNGTQNLVTSANAGVGNAAVQMLATLCNMILSQSIQSLIVSSAEDSGKYAQNIVELLSTITESSSAILHAGIQANRAISSHNHSVHPTLDNEIDEMFKLSPVGELLPTVLNATALLFESHADKLISSVGDNLSQSLTACLDASQKIVQLIPKSKSQSTSQSIIKTTSQVYESLHPYLSNTDEFIEASFPGAIRITITFDQETKTENNYDYVKLWKDRAKTATWHPAVEKYTGRNGSENWPGQADRPPLVIEGSEFFIEWHSDGSNEDWGWKFTAVVEFRRKQTSQTHWFFDLEKQLSYCASNTASGMIASTPWVKEKEDRACYWMEDSLLDYGFRDESEMELEKGENDEDNFLSDFELRPEGSKAAVVCRIMKSHVIEDKGQVDDINRAVYSTCAALLKHNNLVTEALALAKDIKQKPSEKLIKVWRAGQKMHSFFAFGDVRDATKSETQEHDLDELPPPPTMERGPSIYSGADVDVVRKTAEEVIHRAKFLLRVNSTVRTAAVAKEVAKKRWGLVAQSALIRSKSHEETDLGGKWHALVGEAQAASKLKDMLSHRRKEASIRKQGTSALTTSEKVLRFVQGHVNVEDLETIRKLRNSRAKIRSRGFEMMSHLISVAQTPFAAKWLMSSLSRAIRSTMRPEGVRSHVHYLNSIEGCSAEERGLVMKSFCSILEKCVQMMTRTYAQSNTDITENEKVEWKSVTISCIRAISIDYDLIDHTILEDSNILSELQYFLRAKDFEVQRTAWSFFEVLLPRCVGLEGQRLTQNTDEPSEFSKKLVALLINELDRAAKQVTQVSKFDSKSTLNGNGFLIVPETVALRPDSLGFSATHQPIGLYHTFSFWLKRPKSSIEDSLHLGTPKEGYRVFRGPDWKKGSVEDGGPGRYGTIDKVDGERVSVKWDNKTSGKYKFGVVENGQPVYEVSIVDESVGGHIFSKGMRALLSDEDDCVVWSTFGVNLRSNATIELFSACGGDDFYSSLGRDKVPADEWTHVAIVQEKSKNRIFLNGKLDCENTILGHMLYPGKGSRDTIVIESPHPYRDNSDEYTVVHEEGALSYTITFDPRSKTEANYDFIKFYKDDAHNDFWGEEKYTGGRGGSSMNWPGTEGRPALIIPAERFVVYFKSDGSNNDWGYKINIAVEKQSKEQDTEKMIDVLNDKPFYIGQMPAYVNNLRSSSKSINGLLSNLSVYPRSLSHEEIQQQLHENPESELDVNDEILSLDVLSMMNKSCGAFKNAPVHVSNAFVGPSVVNTIFGFVARGTPIVQSAALRVCSGLLPACPIDMVDVQAKRSGLCRNDSFLFYLFYRIGEVMNVWSKYGSTSPTAVVCSEQEMSIGMEYLNLLNALCVSDNWQQTILQMVESFIQSVTPSVVHDILNLCNEETRLGQSLPNINVSVESLNIAFAIMGLLGGSLSGFSTGSSAKYTASDDSGMSEDCTILSCTWPPAEDTLPKDQIPMWKDLVSFGDAYIIVLNSQPGESMVVPRTKLSVVPSPFSQEMSQFLSKLSKPLVHLFTLVCSIDCTDKRPSRVPKVKESDEVLEFESAHPYSDNSEIYTEIKMPGAKNITIEFDRRTRTEASSDYVRFYKDDTHSAYYGADMYHGRDSSQHWPGLNNVPPLVIPADSCVLYFHSDGSNNDWGYKFTAKAHCVVKTFPPERPPLLHNSVAGHLKLLGMNALRTLLEEFSWFSVVSLPLLPNLLGSALAPLPSAKISVARKPLTFESDHPYNHNLDQYTPVKIPGAKKLIITFDEQTATENGCDYVRLYKDDSRTEYWGENQYTGGKDGGNSNWPGMKGRPPLIINADSFVIYFHTDGSVNAWGWLMTVKAGDSAGDSIRPVMDSAICNYRASCCQLVLREAPAKYLNPPGLEDFALETAPDFSTVLRLDISDELDSVADAMEIVEPTSTMSPLDKKKSDITTLLARQKGNRVSWPKDFIVNPKDTNEVQIRSEHEDSSDVLQVISKGTIVSAGGEKGDWLQITAPAVGDATTSVTGWAKRRSGDQQYLLPVTNSSDLPVEDEDLITLPDEEIISTKSKHPMFDIDDSGVTQSNKRDIQPTTVEVLQSAQGCVEQLAADMFQLGSICVAQDCISKLISIWPEEVPFTSESFGTSGKLLAYIRAAFLRETSELRSGTVIGGPNTSLGALKTRIIDVVRKETDISNGSPPLCDLLMMYAVKQLSESLRLATALAPVKAKVKHLESKHNYDDNMDTYTDLSIPGAKRLQLVFDKRSSTEKDCDYVVIYRDQSRSQTIGPRYTGRASSSDKVFAGVASTPPCNVPGDSCVVHFHSDGSNNDWGYKITCYGIMDEPTDEEREKVTAERTSPNAPIPELACWLLEFLVKENNPSVYRNLYAPSTIATLRRYVEIMPPQKKLFAINLLTSMIQEVGRASISQEAMDEILLLKAIIVDLATKQHTLEFTINGGNSTEISQLLQSFIQAAIVLDSSVSILSLDKDSLKSGRKGKLPARIEEEESKEDLTNESKDSMEISQPSEDPIGWCLEPLGRNLELADARKTVRRRPFVLTTEYSSSIFVQPYPKGTHTNHVRLNYFSGNGPIVGAALKTIDFNQPLGYGEVFSVGWGSQKLYVSTLSEPITFGPKFVVGDIISVAVDNDKKTIAYYRNQALVGVAIGPIGSGAIHEVNFPLEEALHLAVSLGNPGDSVQLLESIPPPIAPITTASALASLPSDMPEWFVPIRAGVMLLRSCSARELPTSVFSRDFVPMCEAKSQIIVETAHPYNGEAIDREINIPGAESLTVRFDSATKMGPRDVISIQGSLIRGERQRFEYTGLSSGSVLSNSDEVNVISVSDKVVRGPTWDWGDQDGGAGSFGEVIEVTTWKGKPNAGVSVRWKDTDFVGLYRWDFEGFFDLLVVGQSEKSMKPLNITGDSLNLQIIPGPDSQGGSTQTVDWAGALSFNGSSFLEMPSIDAMELTGDFTVEAWIKVAPASSPSECMVLFSRQIELDGKISQFAFTLGWPGERGISQLVLHCSNVEMAAALHLFGGAIAPGVWTHVAASMNGNNSALFVNGTLVASSSAVAGSGRIGSLGAPLYVGKNSDETCYFKGNMFDIRVWNYARTIDVIQAEKNCVRSATTAGLMSCLGISQSPAPDVLFDLVPPNLPVPAPEVTWDTTVEPNVLPVGTKFGLKCIITPKFSLNTVLQSSQFQDILLNLQSQYTVGEFRHDLALVRYVNQVSRAKKMTLTQLLNCKWSDISPSEEELVRMPVLKELVSLRDTRLEQLSEAKIEEEKTVETPAEVSKEEPHQEGMKFKVKSHQHELEFINRDNGWSCSGMTELVGGCKRGCTGFHQTTGWPRYRCEECDFDYCDLCFQQERVQPASQSQTSLQPDRILKPVEARFKLLQMLNKSLESTISYIDLCTIDKPWSVASLLSACRGLIFESTKNPIWESAMISSASPSSSQFEMRISRPRAAKFSRTGQVDHEARHMVFSQVFRQMHPMPPSSLRRTDKLYNVMFLGERAQDAGGPYRESYATMANELQSRALPLLLRTPNGRDSVGQNREKWVLNPGATTSLHMDMFCFLGKLMGIAIRTKEYLALDIPSIVWKLLVGETPNREDLEAIDLFQIQSLEKLRNIHLHGIDSESFGYTFYETFVTISTDSRTIELIPNGKEKDVTFENRNYYCDLVEQYRLHEFDRQAAAVRQGLGCMIPSRLLSIYTWDQLEEMVCGRPTIDIQLLKSVTEYSSCSANDAHILLFWQAMEEFTNEERSMFIRFTWGRSRLPLTADSFPQRFKLQSFGKSPPDSYLPISHTCFFSVELPRYSTLEIMKDKLRYAIYNCQAIDGDDTSVGMQAASMGWEE